MKRFFILTLALASTLFVCCDPDSDLNQEGSKFVEPELSVNQDTLALGKNAGATATFTITTDQDAISAEVYSEYRSWLKISIDGKTVTVTTVQGNKTGAVRQGVILVTVGEKGVTKEMEVFVKQETGTPDILDLSETEIRLKETAGLEGTVTYTTNLSSIQINIPDDAKAWLSATDAAGTITFKTLTDNLTETNNETSVKIIAGDLVKTVKVTQTGITPELNLSAEAASLAKEADSAAEITYNTNQASVVANVPADAASWLSATVSEGKITFKAISGNTEMNVRTATVALVAGTLTKNVTITQKGFSYLGTDYGTGDTIGIIFWVDPENPLHVKVMSAKAQACAWCTEKDRVDGVSSNLSSKEANEIIRQRPGYPAEYPAFKFCEDMGTDWYIPNSSEAEFIAALYCGVDSYTDVYKEDAASKEPAPQPQLAARKAFDEHLVAIGGSVMNPQGYDVSGDSIHLCRETTAGKQYSFRFGKIGSLNSHAKNGDARIARCVKEVTIEK